MIKKYQPLKKAGFTEKEITDFFEKIKEMK